MTKIHEQSEARVSKVQMIFQFKSLYLTKTEKNRWCLIEATKTDEWSEAGAPEWQILWKIEALDSTLYTRKASLSIIVD